MLAVLRVPVLIAVSLSAFVPAFAAPVRLSTPHWIYSDVIQTGALEPAARGAIERSVKSVHGWLRAPFRAEHPSPALLYKYEEHHRIYNDKPRALWKQETAPPLAVERNRTVEDRVRIKCNQHRQSGLPAPLECLCSSGLMAGACDR
jgi:hypothetical protein